jgi:hypothetical protein
MAEKTRGTQAIIPAILCMLLILLSAQAQQPTGPDEIINLSTETAPVRGAYMLNTSGGTFTTLIINVTATTYRWKAYAGNITGKLTLDDSLNYTIFDWTIAIVTGEIYATRAATLIDWAKIGCANATHVAQEEYALNITASQDDSINRTFIASQDIHDSFYVGSAYIENNTCPSISTYVNNTPQNESFQEVLLYDNSTIVYTGLLEDSVKGFDNNYYDFQLIVPESGLEGQQAPTPYYFYVELI